MINEGAVPVTNDTSISILDTLESADKTLSDISYELGISTSTVFFSLKNLVKTGIVKSYPDAVNKKKVLYSNCAIKIMEIRQPNPKLESLMESILKKTVSDSTYFYRGLLMYITVNCMRGGINITPALDYAGRILAVQMRDHIRSDDINQIFYQIFKFGKAANMPDATIHSVMPLTIDIERVMNMDKDMLPIYAACIGFTIQILSDNLGTRYNLASQEIISDTVARFVLTPTECNSCDIETIGTVGKNLEIKPFMVIYFDDYVKAVENKNQIDILRSLESGDQTSAEISQDTGIPLPTVLSNLNKMTEARWIEPYSDGVKNGNTYKLRAYIALNTKPLSNIPKSAMDKAVKDAAEQPEFYFRNVLISLIHLFDSLGICWAQTLKHVGAAIARESISKSAGMNPDEFMKKLCDSDMPFRSKVSVASRFPVKYRVTFSSAYDSAISKGLKDVYDGIFTTIFNEFSDIKCIAHRVDVNAEPLEVEYSAIYID